MDRPQVLHAEALEIPLRCRNATVSEDLRQIEQVSSCPQVIHSECMPERVEAHPNTSHAERFPEKL